MTRRRFILFLAALLVAAVMSAAGFVFMLWKDRTYFVSPPYERKGDDPSGVLVVCYSRSGNTLAMAKEIARTFKAELISLDAKAYSLDFEGWSNAYDDAWDKLPAVIDPDRVNMDSYDLLFLGSPIWWYRPAPPLWTFVEKNDFRGKAVILFNTFNSRFEPEEIETFRKLVERKGGKLIDHVHVRRGRIFNQIDGGELVKEVRKLLDARAGTWRGMVDPTARISRHPKSPI
jgi:flavodoxin